MNRRNLGTSSGRREKAMDKSAMERMVRQNRARRKKRRKDKSISLAATMSKNVIALATSLHGIGPLIQNGTFRKRVSLPLGILDITLYRDDILSCDAVVKGTEIDFDITGKTIVLCDDVLYTGRTVRAAISALVSLSGKMGRAKKIQQNAC